MLTVYRRSHCEKNSHSRSSSSESNVGTNTLPHGRPYITKVNGRLVMARTKNPRPAGSNVDLLGTAFGLRTRIVRRRSKSVDSIPCLTGAPNNVGEPHILPQQHLLTYSTPLLQNGFLPVLPMNMMSTPQAQQPPQIFQAMQYQQPLQCPQHMPQEPTKYRVEVQAPPSKQDIENLKNIHAHFTASAGKDKNVHDYVNFSSLQDMNERMVSKTTSTVARHVCARCGRTRSRKYHNENPIKPGRALAPALCRKCSKDASSTSSEGMASHVGRNGNGDKRKVYIKLADAKSGITTARPEIGKRRGQSKRVTRYAFDKEDSPGELSLKGQDFRRIKRSDPLKRPLSPLISKSDYRKSRDSSDVDCYDIPVKRYSHRKRECALRVLVDDEDYDMPPERNTKKEQRHTSYYESETYPNLTYNESGQTRYINRHNQRQRDGRRWEDKEGPTIGTEEPAGSSNVFRGQMLLNSSDSFDSNKSYRSQQRRQERLYPDESKLWDELHEISPKPRHRVTVKETYTFRPKKEAYVEPDIGIGENLPRERHNDGGRSKDYEVSHENPALNTAKHIHRTSSNADKLRQSPDKNFTYRYASPQYGKSRHNDTLYYDVPQHRISRHNVTDDDHAYYQSDWLREESHENIDGYVDRASLQAYSPSDSSSILYQRAYKAAHQNIPRAPTPPHPSYLSQQPFYQVSGGEGITLNERTSASRERNSSPFYERPTKPSINIQSIESLREAAAEAKQVHNRGSFRQSIAEAIPRPNSAHESLYARSSSANDAELSQAIVPSPKADQAAEVAFRNSFSQGYDDGFSVSDFTEREAAAEAAISGRKVKFQGPDEVIDASDVAFRKKVDGWGGRGRGFEWDHD